MVNAKLGFEVLTWPHWPIRFGVYTNHSAAPPIPATSLMQLPPDIDIYGATFSLGFRGKHAGINFGVNAQYGLGDDLVIEDVAHGYQGAPRVRVTREYSKLIFFLAGAFDFAKSEAIGLFDDDLEAR